MQYPRYFIPTNPKAVFVSDVKYMYFKSEKSSGVFVFKGEKSSGVFVFKGEKSSGVFVFKGGGKEWQSCYILDGLSDSICNWKEILPQEVALL